MSDSSICMQHTRTCGMSVNIAPRDLLIQQRRPGHPGNVVHTAGLPVHSPVVLKMASHPTEIKVTQRNFLLLCSYIV